MTSNVQTDTSQASTRDWRLDLLRILACAQVVLLHAVSSYAAVENTTVSGVFGAFFNAMIREPIPLFLMLGGYFFLSKSQSVRRPCQLIFARWRRILPALLLWSTLCALAYVAPRIALALRVGKPITMAQWRVFFYDWAIYGKPGVGYHLWYLYVILVCEPIVLVIAHAMRKASRRRTFLATCLWSLLGAATATTLIALGHGNLPFVSIGVMVVPYYFWGKWLFERIKARQSDLSWRAKLASWAIFLGVVALIMTLSSLGAQDYARSYLLPHAPLHAVALCLIVTSLKFKPSESTKRILQILSQQTFGAYLCHIFFLALAQRAVPILWHTECFARALLTGAIALALSHLFVWTYKNLS
ncbi:MAG: acyltransferase [Planctomycetia bacterium]|nr:acyltransferase [Planctomycetia bacterium]